MSGKAGGSGQGNEDAPIDFNDCVSKNELHAVLDDKFNEILRKSPTWQRGLKILNNDILNHVLKMLLMMISLRRMMATRRLKLKPKLNDVLRIHVTIIG